MKYKNHPQIFILTPNPFPQGNVATNRFTTYAKALAQENCNVKIIILKGTENSEKCLNKSKVGTFEGIRYEYMSSTTQWDTSWPIVFKGILYLRGVLLAAWRIFVDRPDCIIMYTNDMFYMAFFAVISRSLKINIFIDKSEYPITRKRKLGVISWIYNSLYMTTFKLFDGIIVITKELSQYYSKIIRSSASVFLLPMTVDFARFPIAKESDIAKYICCVFGVHNRDCLLDTVMAFESFTQKTSDREMKLLLIGDIHNLVNGDAVKKYVQTSGITDRIIFRGPISAKDVVPYLIRATALITTPKSYESGGFPTKLGEYLASSRPVVATRAGEIPFYLTNLYDCLLAEPGDIDELSTHLASVSESPSRSTQIGRQGRETAYSCFNAKQYVFELKKFLLSHKFK